MLILLISSMKGLGGTERSTQTLSELLTGKGHEVHLLGAHGPLCDDIENLGVKYFDVETHANSVGGNIQFLNKLVELLKTYPYDCVHLQMARPVPIAVLAKQLAGSKTKIIWHSRGVHASTYQYVPRLFSSLGVRAIGNCKAEQEKLVRYGFRSDRVGFLYNPCRIEHVRGSRSQFREQYGFQDKDIVIGSLSRLNPARGVHYAINYFDELCQKHSQLDRTYLLIAGDGEERKNLEKLAAKTSVANRIKFIGGIKDTQNFYAGIDLFWNPVAFKKEESAGTGNTVIEAAFQRVPMVSHDWGGVTEIVIDGITGGVAPVGGSTEFVEKTVNLLTDKEFQNSVVEKAFGHVSKLVGSAACVEKVEHYYLKL
ncbi:glycosyltransferase family 4 protein [Leptothoe spongobia]|uniref:Glycosyltransferase family 4 protein n=1 Tax=Leptothoe spongobia TAU-MAC 1115 TaxID=1967444 RepID=A0A947GJH4_9CYAN|nr:glycosyltransferase family 4 protein [Leptothoe spongobia]MBT9315657.1 glycosyltransferase family 4 protein [Leptothoe spongobia TAU-MAC 1115]